jgi:hypothetical protein
MDWMSGDPTSPDFDWITVRYRCTAREAFPRLRDMAERNVEMRCEQIKSDPHECAAPEFAVENNGTPTFTVRRGVGQNPANDLAVRFRLIDALTIRVDGNGLPASFDVRVGMDDQGKCLLLVDDTARKDWQILHRGLDELLFSDPRSAGMGSGSL